MVPLTVAIIMTLLTCQLSTSFGSQGDEFKNLAKVGSPLKGPREPRLDLPVELMVALGDSITAGTFADSAPPSGAFELGFFRGPSSFTIEIDAPVDVRLDSHPELSWSSGEVVQSHFVNLKKILEAAGAPVHLEAINVSKPGSKVGSIPDQLREVRNAMVTGKYARLRYVTLFVGANDLCRGGRVKIRSDSIGTLMKAFETLSEIQSHSSSPSEPTHVLVVGLPRIPDLSRPEVLKARTKFGLTCELLRDRVFNACPALLNWKTQPQYEKNIGRVKEMNLILEHLVSEVQGKFPNLKVFFTQTLFEKEIPLSNLAFDCFHPSRLGQEAISKLLWNDQPWF